MTDDLIARLYRSHYSKMVASLASYFGLKNLALVEDIVQDTFASALEHWPQQTPDAPASWLFKVCKNKALNALSKKQAISMDVLPEARDTAHLDQIFLDHEIKDNQLRLLFAFCHPTLAPKTQVMLILKNICALKTSEIASALVMQEEAVTRALNRSRHQLLDEGAAMHVPFLMRSRERLATVLLAMYLLFNEGYFAKGDLIIRRELCLEAMRVVHEIATIPEIRSADTYALLALMCYHAARFDARVGVEGELVELEQQDRAKWDKELVSLGNRYLAQASEGARSRFQVEAAIASLHCNADSFQQTDWPAIVELYKILTGMLPTPIVELNYAVATWHASGAASALLILEQSPHLNWLKHHYQYHALLGRIYECRGDNDLATRHYETAARDAGSTAEKVFLQTRLEKLKSRE